MAASTVAGLSLTATSSLGRREPMRGPLRHDGTQGRRLERLMEYLDGERACSLAHLRGAIGRDEHGWNFRSEEPPQLSDGFNTVAVVEMIVDQKPARELASGPQGRNGFRQIGGLNRLASPAPQQRHHPVQDIGIVVDTEHENFGDAAAVDARLRQTRLAQLRRRNRNVNRKMCTSVDLRSECNRMIENTGNAFHDRKTEPETAGDLGAPVEAMKLGEDSTAFVWRNPNAGIEHIDTYTLPATPTTDQNAASSGVFDG